MGRQPFSPEEVEVQRALVVRAAEGLFADRGYAGVTLRALAKALGRSPTAAYRYFEGKAEIFAAARTAAYRRFAEAQERAVRGGAGPLERLARLGSAYVQFAVDEPDAYRLMFELKQPEAGRSAALREAEDRAWAPLRETIEAVVDAGHLRGDPHEVTHLFWAGMHGVVSLQLAGKLSHGLALEDLDGPMKRLLFLGGRAPSGS
jgi:AcrR family transcriptional regulator